MPAPAAFVVPSLAAALVAMLAFAGGRMREAHLLNQLMADGVPLLDPSTPDGRQELLLAATRLGVFRVRQPASVNGSAVLNAARAFFSQPDDVKRSARSASGASGGFERGYIPLAGESGLRQFVELKEGFCYGREGGVIRADAATKNATQDDTCESLLIKPNAWPVAPADMPSSAVGDSWRHVILSFLEDCITLTDTLAVQLFRAVGKDPRAIAELARGGEDISLMRLFHYFRPTVAPDLAPGLPRTGSSPHTDWHLLTIILQDTTGGLQIRRPEPPYDWIDVPAKEGELIVIIGDYLSALSDGRFISPVHRVLLPTSEAPPDDERFSFTYFRYPHCAATVPSASASHAERRARRRAKEMKRHLGSGSAEAFNTLVRPAPDGDGVGTLASNPFGQLLLDKWRGVASNKQ